MGTCRIRKTAPTRTAFISKAFCIAGPPRGERCVQLACRSCTPGGGIPMNAGKMWPQHGAGALRKAVAMPDGPLYFVAFARPTWRESRMFSRMLLALALSALAVPAWAQGYPSKPVRVIVTFPPGGTPDIYGRVMSAELQKVWSQSVVVENRTGAGGTIGSDYVAKAPPDGYTLLFAADATITIAPHLYSKLPYDPVRVLGRGRPAASRDGIHPYHGGQHGHDPRALQGIRPGNRRRARQPGAAYLRRHHRLDPAHEERQAQGARGHRSEEGQGAAERAGGRRDPARLRHHRLVRLSHAGGHFTRDRE